MTNLRPDPRFDRSVHDAGGMDDNLDAGNVSYAPVDRSDQERSADLLRIQQESTAGNLTATAYLANPDDRGAFVRLYRAWRDDRIPKDAQ